MSLNLPAGFFAAAALAAFGALGHRASLAAAFAPAEHLHHVGADLGAIAVLAVLVLALARAQLALDVDLRALLQVLAGDLGEAAEEGDAMPLGGFLLLAARLVLPRVGRRDANVGDGVTARQIFGFRVGAEIADDDDLVHRCHITPLV